MSGLEIQAVITDMGQRAQAAGYDPRRAIERMTYGSFVSPGKRYFYMETPKAACTAFKHLIAAIEGIIPDPLAMPYQRETRHDMLIHQRRQFAMPTLINAGAGPREAILSHAPGWMSFAIVRNPFSRLVSFFEHKIRMGEPGYGAMTARYGDVSSFGGVRATFCRFVEEVVADPNVRESDSHLMPQAGILMPRLIPYSHIFHLEAVEDAVTALGAHLGQAITLRRTPSAGRDWRHYYDGRSAGIVAGLFAQDFALFGYDPADWRAQSHTPPPVNEEFWRSEVAARNAMIELLYDRLGLRQANSFVEIRKFL